VNNRVPRLCVLASGGGTTLQNLIGHIRDGRLAAEITGVISSSDKAYVLSRAHHEGIPSRVVPRGRPLDAFSEAVFAAIRQFQPDWVCLAGWLHLIQIPPDFHHRVLNIHPSLLPAFGGHGMYGRHVHSAVLASGARISGCTVHFADDTYDTGPILLQRTVPVHDDDTPESLAARVFEAECEAYPESIRRVASGRFRVEGRRVHYEPPSS
jgi:phosphoribosylglycinamide formyltransferase-1